MFSFLCVRPSDLMHSVAGANSNRNNNKIAENRDHPLTYLAPQVVPVRIILCQDSLSWLKKASRSLICNCSGHGSDCKTPETDFFQRTPQTCLSTLVHSCGRPPLSLGWCCFEVRKFPCHDSNFHKKSPVLLTKGRKATFHWKRKLLWKDNSNICSRARIACKRQHVNLQCEGEGSLYGSR